MKRLIALARAAATTWSAERTRLREALRRRRMRLSLTEHLETRVHLTSAHTLINLDAFRADPRFIGIDGSGGDIVIIDGSFDLNHSDFKGTGTTSRIHYSYDFADNDANAHNAGDEHGTHVASIAAGKLHGIAPGAKLILLKAAPDSNLDRLPGVAGALDWVRDNGVNGTYNVVSVNMSLGTDEQYIVADKDDLASYGATLTTIGNGKKILLLAAAGNEYITINSFGPGASGIESPAIHTKVVAISNVHSKSNPDYNKTFFTKVPPDGNVEVPSIKPDQFHISSNRHPTLTDLLAPGVTITAAVPNRVPLKANPTGELTGTSMATPAVSGVVALIQQLARLKLGAQLPTNDPSNPLDLLKLLQSTGTIVHDDGYGVLYSNPTDGIEDRPFTGSGGPYRRIDVRAAAERVLELRLSIPTSYSADTFYAEFNQFGKFETVYDDAGAHGGRQYLFKAPAMGRYSVELKKPKSPPGSAGKNLPPSLVLQHRSPLSTITARAPHGRIKTNNTLAAGMYGVVLQSQSAAVGDYAAPVAISGPKPATVADWSALWDHKTGGVVPSDGQAQYFGWKPVSASGSIKVTQGFGSLVPVISIFDKDGKLVARKEGVGSATAGDTLNFSGLQAGKSYVIRVGAKEYASFGNFDIDVSYASALRSGSGDSDGDIDAAPVSGAMESGVGAALLAGIQAFGRAAGQLDATGEFARRLPMLQKTQGELADIAGAVRDGLVNPLTTALSGLTTYEQVAAALNALETTAIPNFTFGVAPGSVALYRDGEQVKFGLTLQGQRISPAAVDFSGVNGVDGLSFGNGLTADVETTFSFDLTFGVDLDAAVAIAERASVDVGSFRVESRLDEAAINAYVRQGLASGSVVDGFVDLRATVDASFGVGGIAGALTAAQLDGAQIADIVTLTPLGSLSVELPIEARIGDWSEANARVQIADANVYDGVAVTATKQNFTELDQFDSMSPAELLTLLRGLEEKVRSIVNLPAINTPIPFTDGKTLAQLLGVDGLLKAVNDVLTRADNAAAFLSGDDLIGQISELLELPFVSQNYDPATNDLSFSIHFDESINTTLPFRVDMRTSVLNVNATADVAVSANLSFGLTFGVNLAAPGAGVSIAQRFFLDDGRLDAGVHLAVTNIGGSAKLFNFLGAGFSGGTGLADATIGFDLFGGQRVTLVDVGRSIANGGAAIAGASPVPAAIGNLVYTGSGSLDLGTPTISGFSNFVPSVTSKIKINLPDFKTPEVLNLDTTQLGELLDFQNLSFDDLIGAIRTFVGGLRDKLAGSILAHKIPGTGKSIRDLVDFIDKLADAVQSLQNGDQTTLDAAKDLLQQKIRTALGAPATGPIVTLDLTRVGLRKVISMRLTSSGSVSTTIPFNLDVAELVGSGAIGGLPAAASSFFDASASGSFAFDGSYNFTLGFGVDLSSPLDPTPFITDDSGFTLTAKVIADQTLQATLGIGPLAIYVKNGTIKLTNALGGTSPASYGFAFPPTAPGEGGRIGLSDALGLIADLDDRLTLTAAVDVRLPMFGPTSTQPLAATNGDARGNVFTAQIPSVSAFFGGASPTLYSPDISSLLSNVNFSGGMGSLINGLDLLLDNLSKLFKGQMFGIDLPLVGDKLKSTAAVGFIDDMRAKFAQLLGTPAALASEIRDRLQLALTQLSMTSIVVNYTAYKMVGTTLTSQGTTVDADTIQILFNLSGNGTRLTTVPLALKKRPFPGMDLEVKSATGGDPTLDIDLAYALNLKFGIHKDSGFFIDTSAANELAANAFVRFNGTPTLGGSLGFLKLSATNDTTQTTSFPASGALPARNFTGTVVGGSFVANLKPLVAATNRLTFAELTRPGIFEQDILDYTFAAQAKMALKMTLGTEGSVLGFDLASLPKLTADFLMNWAFNASDTAPNPSGSPNTVRFNNVKLDIGEFLTRQIRPVLASLHKAMAPLRPAIDLFQIALPVINDIASIRDAVDLNNDGRATLRDLVQAWSGGNTPALQFLDLFTSLDNLYNSLESLTTTSNLLLTLGNFDVSTAGGVSSLVPFGAAPATVDAQLNALGTSATVNAAKQFRSIQNTYAGASGGRFSIPLFGDPTSALGLLLGKDVSLVQIDFPKLEFGVEFSQSFFIFPAISVEVVAYLKGFADFGVGYDTRGFRQFYDSGYANTSLLANGFYLRDKKEIGGTLVDVPEFGFSGGIALYAGLDVVLFSLKVGGGVDAELFADLRDPNNDGRINLDEFLANFGPDLFDMYGSITASLKARAKIGFWPLRKTFNKNLATVTLVDFNTKGNGNVGSVSGGTLTLPGTPEDDFFVVRHLGGDANTTAGEKVQVSGAGGTKIFDGVRRISFNGGAGHDRVSFVLEEVDANDDGVFESRTAVNAPATLIGGEGDDVFATGDGNDSIDGGAGDDELSGSAGNDTILAGDGDDAILGGAGNDAITAGVGNDDVDAGLGNDTASGGAGDDIILGGGGADSIDGGDGNDDLVGDDPDDAIDPGPIGNDTILGGNGNDAITGGGGNDSLLAGAGADTVQGDDGNDTIDGGLDDDSLAGNVGSDSILGGEGHDTLLGHSGGAGDAGVDDDRLFGNGGNDSIIAGLGADRGEGGLGLDTILGGSGNDTLVGGTGAAGAADVSGDSLVGGAGFDWMFGDDGTVSATNVVTLFNAATGGADRIDGEDDADTIYGQASADYITAGRGNDSVVAGDGDDTLLGQDGNDTLLGEVGNDQLQGFSGNDSLLGGDGNDQILGGTGIDTVVGGLGNDDLYGNEDADLVYGNSGADTVQGGSGADTLVGGGGGGDQAFGHSLSGIGDDGAIDLIYGGRAVGQAFVDADTIADGNDTLAGQGGNDVALGEEGDDAIAGGDGNDSLDGGVGNDLLRGDAGLDTLLGQANDDVIHGGADGDSLVGSTGNDRLFGDAGNDSVVGDAGNDHLEGGAGDDSLLGADGNDTVIGDAGVDTLRGELGNDSLDAGAGGGELLDGGVGDDFIRAANADAQGDNITAGDGRDTIQALGGADTIDAGLGDDSVDAGSGNDVITLGDGNDTLYAGDGNDNIDAGTGSDAVYGEAGNDTVLGNIGHDLLDGGAGTDSLVGGAGDDDLRAGTGAGDQILGEAGNDILTGSNDGADVMDGGDGDDQLSGLAGNDTLRGGLGADVIDAGAGDDLIEGGAAADLLVGGRDHDLLYGHSLSGVADDGAVDTIYGDLGTGGDDAGAGRDQLYGGAGFDVLYGEGEDDFIADFGAGDMIYFGAGDGATPNNYVAPPSMPAPGAVPPATLPPRGPTLPGGTLPIGRWTEIAGASAGGSLGPANSVTAIAIDATGRRYVVWSDVRNGNPEIYLARHDGTGWSQLAGSTSFGGVSNTTTASTQPSLALDASGNPMLAWIEGTGTAANVYAARFNGTAWVAMGSSFTGGGISGTGAASCVTILDTASGPMVAWIDASSGSPQVYLKQFNGSAWVAPAAGAASGAGVSAGAAGVSELTAATDGTRLALAWTQTVGGITQVMLRELVGGALVERSGSATGSGASAAPYGASSATLAYVGGTLHLAFVARLLGSSPLSGILARRHDGTGWAQSNTVISPAAGASGNMSSPKLAVGGGQLRLGWIDQRSGPALRSHASFARFDGSSFVSELGLASADGFDTTSSRLAMALDAAGRPIVSLADNGEVRVVAGGPAVARVFVADAATTVASILAAHDLGPGDTILIKGSVAGFTIGGDDAGVAIVGDRATAPTITSAVIIGVPDVQLANLTITGAITATAGGVSITNSTLAGATSVGGANVTLSGNVISGAVTVGVVTSGTISGNTFAVANTVTALTVSATFTGAIRGNTFSGAAVGILVSAANVPIGGNTFTGNVVGVRASGLTVALGVAGTTPNVFRANATAVNLVGGAAVLRQTFIENTTGVTGNGTVGGATPADGNTFDANTTAVNVSSTNVLFNRFTRNGVAVIAGASTRVAQNQISDSGGDGIRATGARVTITHNSIVVGGRAIDVTATASEVEIRNNVLVSNGSGYSIYVDSAGRTGFWSDYNLLHAADTGHLVRWLGVDFDDILDWQQDVFRYDMHSTGRTLVNPGATVPRFAGTDSLAAAPTQGGGRSSSPAVDAGDPLVDVGVTRARTNLLANPSFEAAVAPTGWTTNAVGTTLTTPLLAFDGGRYFTTGATTNGFAEQTINLLTSGFTAGQLDTQDLAAVAGARVRIAGGTRLSITFVNASNAAIGVPAEFNGSADGSRWESIGGRVLVPIGTRAIKVRIDGVTASSAVDNAFLYVESSAFAPDAGYGGSTALDPATSQPRIVLRSTDLYTDMVVDKPTVIRWETFGNVNKRAVKIELLKDNGSNGPQYLLTIAATASDTGSFEFRPSDFGLAAGTSGYRVRVSLVGEDNATDRATEPSAIVEAGENYYVDDRSDTGDEYTGAAIGSNRNSGKTAASPKPLLTSVLRIYDLGPTSTLHVDTGNYTHFDTTLISGTVGVGDDEGVTIVGPSDDAKVATLTMAYQTVGFSLSDGDAVTLDGLRIVGATRGVLVAADSLNFTGRRLTIVSPTLTGVYLTASSGANLSRITVTGSAGVGIFADTYVNTISNSTITGSAGIGIDLNAGVGLLSGSLVQGNREGIEFTTGGGSVISGNRVLNNTEWGIWTTGKVTVSGNTVSGHTNGAYAGIRLDNNAAIATGNFLSGNAVGILAVNSNTTITSNRVEGSSVGIDSFDSALIAGNVVVGGTTGIRLRQSFANVVRVVRNNVTYGQSGWGIALVGLTSQGALVENNTVDAGNAVGIEANGVSANIRLKNNIITVNNGRGVVIASDTQSGFASNYNLFHVTGTGHVGTWQGVNRTSFGDWRAATAVDVNSLYGDPLFVNRAAGDYHEQSQHGSNKGGTLAPIFDVATGLPVANPGTYSNDAVTSPALDRGDPTSPYSNELPPNGGFVNIGAYGNTPQAALSPTAYITVTSPAGSVQWPAGQSFNINWLSQDYTGTVVITLMRGNLPVLTIATGEVNDGSYLWSIPGSVTPADDYVVRISRTGASGDSSPFSILAPTSVYYVNDGDTAGDVFTTAPGTIAGNGLSAATANSSIRFILDNYDLGPGDVIRVDSGTYNLSTEIIMAAEDSGVTIEGPAWTTTPLVTLNRGNTAASTAVFISTGGDNFTLRNLNLLSGGYGVHLNSGGEADDVVLDRLRISGYSEDGVWSSGGNDRLTVRNSTIIGGGGNHRGLNVSSPFALLENNTISNNSYNIEVRGRGTVVQGNTLSGARSYSVYAVYGTHSDVTSPVVVRNNTITGGVVNSIGIRASEEILVEGNTVSGFTTNFGIHGNGNLVVIRGNLVSGNRDGINVDGGRAENNTLVSNALSGITGYGAYITGNTIRNNPTGIFLGGTGASTKLIANNLITGTSFAGIDYRSVQTAQPARIVNNTIVASAGRGFYGGTSDWGPSRSAQLRNNIFSLSGTAIAFEIVTSANLGFSSNYNLYHLTGTGAFGISQGVTFAALANWQATLGQESDGFVANPLFVNPAGNDYTLQAGSPALDSGDPDTYYLGETSHSGGRADIGLTGNTARALASAPQVVQVVDPNGYERFETGTATTIRVRGFGLGATDNVALIDAGTVNGFGAWLWDGPYGSNAHVFTESSGALVAGVANAAPAEVYNSIAIAQAGATSLRYFLPVADGTYTLRLHFMEYLTYAPGQRVMDIRVNGALAVDNFDIRGSGAAYRQAKVVSITVTAADGAGISLELARVVGDAILSGIELVRANPGGVAAPSVDVSLALDGNAASPTYTPIANNVTLDRYGRASLPWTPDQASTQARMRATSTQVPTVSGVSANTFSVLAPVSIYYINDATLNASDRFTTAVGNDANDGKSPATPMASLAALLALYDMDPGSVVYIDAGTYALSARLDIFAADAGVRLEGAGADRTIFNRGNTSIEAFQLANADGVQFANLAITGARIGINLYDGSDSDDVLIENVRIFNNSAYGAFVGDHNDRVIIRNSEFYGAPGGATSADDQNTSIYTRGPNGLISGNDIHHSSIAIFSGSEIVTAINVTISNNSIHDNTSTNGALSVRQVATVVNNTLYNNAAGISVGSGSVARDNLVYGQTVGGDLWGITVDGGVATGNTVRNNRNGIRVYSGSAYGNVSHGNAGSGLAVYGNGTLLNNVTYGNAYGILQSGGMNAGQLLTVGGNLSYANSAAALLVQGGGTQGVTIRFHSNTLVATTGDAIHVSGGGGSAYLDFRNNIIAASAGYGIQILPGAHDRIRGDYNFFQLTGTAKLGRFAGVDSTTLLDWRSRTLMDRHSQVGNAAFMDVAAGDYALSPASPAIDAGDPGSGYHIEPGANGGRINVGHQGNTAAATVSSALVGGRSVHVVSPDGNERLETGQVVRIRYRTSDPALAAPAPSVAGHRAAAIGQAPVGYWSLDETTGTAVADSSGNGRGGTYTASSVTLGTTGRWSDSKAPTFNGTGAGITIANSSLFSSASAITLSSWLNPATGIGKFAGALMNVSAYSLGSWGLGYGIYYADGRINFFVNYERNVVSAPITLDQWSHVAGTFDGTTVRLYVNGALAASNTVQAGDNTNSNGPLYIGSGPGATSWKGKIDEVGYWRAALDDQAIANLYANGGVTTGRTVTLELMREGNATPVATIATGLPINGSYDWTVPAGLVLDADHRIRATYSDGTNVVTDVSNAPVMIVNGGTSYYVNDNSGTGDVYTSSVGDDANSGKSPDRPVLSLQSLLDLYDLGPGDTVYIDSGTYTLPMNLRVGSNDSGAAFVGAGRDLTFLTRANPVAGVYVFEMLGTSNVRIAKMTLTGAQTAIYSPDTSGDSGMVIEDNTIYGNVQHGVALLSETGAVIRRNRIYGIPGGTTTDNQSLGIQVTGSGNQIRDNEVYDSGGNGIQVDGNAVVSGNKVYRNQTGIFASKFIDANATALISGNEVFNNRGDGISVSLDVSVVGNRVYGHTAVGSVGIVAGGYSGSSASNNEVFENYDGIRATSGDVTNNRVYANTRFGIDATGSYVSGNTTYANVYGIVARGNSSVVSNLLYGNTNVGLYVTANSTGSLVAGNTVFQEVGDAVQLAATGTSVRLNGNVLWANGGRAIYVDASSQPGFVSNANLFNTSTSPTAHVGFWGGADRHTFAQWQTATAQDAGSVYGDPLFVDIDGADNLLGYVGGVDRGLDDNFHLRAASPAIDRGHGFGQYTTDANGEKRADDPVTPNAGTPGYVVTNLGSSNFNPTGGTAQNWRGDNSAWTLNLPFSFPLFGVNYTSAVITGKGRLMFGPGWQHRADSFNNLLEYPTVAALWDDIRTDGVAADNIFVDNSVASQTTIRFNATNKADGSDVNFSITLYSTGVIDFNYGAGNTNLTPVVGISGSGSFRPLYALAPYNGQATLTNASTIRFNIAPSVNDIGAFEFQGRSDDATRPTVVSSTPGGVHTGGTVGGVVNAIVVNFSEALDPLDARSTSVYELIGAGPDRSFGTSDDVVYALVPQYTSLGTSVTLGVVGGSLPSGDYRLTIKGAPAGNSGLHDLAGNVLDGGGGAGYVRFFSVAGDQTPPTVTAGTFVLNAPRMKVTITFSEDIGTSISAGDVTLQNLSNPDVGTIPTSQISVVYDAATRTATITYLGTPNGVLPKGQYRLTLGTNSVSDLAGNGLAAPYVLNFNVRPGDLNGDGFVNFDDLLSLAQNYGQPGTKTYAQGDTNYDGTVGFDDLLALAQNYGQSFAQDYERALELVRRRPAPPTPRPRPGAVLPPAPAESLPPVAAMLPAVVLTSGIAEPTATKRPRVSQDVLK